MKTIAEILLNIKDDPDKERLRQETLAKAREWEESEPERHSLPPGYDRPAFGPDPLLDRLQAALPNLNAAQRHMLETLLDSWGA
ncbi:MAG: hypothetical protein AAFV53_09925 [Myxococcota bacterium]